MTIEELKSELTNDPAGLGYNANDWTCLDLLNAPRAPYTRPGGSISQSSLLRWAAKNGALVRIKSAAESAGPLQSIALAALYLMQGATGALDLTSADNVAMIDALVTGGILTAEEKQSLVKLADVPASRSEQLWGRLVTIHEIEAARR
ncbi:MAG: hypothetical protein AB1705_14575 [Verrucomicrobiota bacterium]